MEKYELLLGRGTKLAKNFRIYLCQNGIKMHYFRTKTQNTPSPDPTPLNASTPYSETCNALNVSLKVNKCDYKYSLCNRSNKCMCKLNCSLLRIIVKPLMRFVCL